MLIYKLYNNKFCLFAGIWFFRNWIQEIVYSILLYGPNVIKLFSCSTQLSMKFQLLIKTKLLNNKDCSCFFKVRKGAKTWNQYNQAPHQTEDTNWKVTLMFVFISMINFMGSSTEKLYNPGPWSLKNCFGCFHETTKK